MALILLAVIYLCFISLGLPDSLLGSALPVMQQELEVPMAFMGSISMLISGGTIVSSLLSERLNKKFGTYRVTVVSIALTAAALFGFSVSDSFWQLCLWSIPYGLGAGAIDAALNNYVSLHYSSRHMNWLHCFWGVGTMISPYIMSHALAVSRWQNGYHTVSLIQFTILAIAALSLPLWKVHTTSAATEEKKIVGLKKALGIRGVPCLLFGFLAYCSAESTAMLWTSSYLAGVRHIPEKTAAAFASLFFIGVTAGRFLSGLISNKLGDRRMIRLGTTIAMCGIFLVMLPSAANIFSLAGFLIIGLGCAPVYPCIIHAAPDNFGEENSQAIIGIQMASAYIGSTFMPPLFGLLADHISLKLMPFYLAAFIIITMITVDKTFTIAQNDS